MPESRGEDLTEYKKTIAVDFDGCLCTKKWPDIGDPNLDAIHELISRKAQGDRIILWTCRSGKQLEDAVLWCLNYGLKFDAVNENLPEHIEFFGSDTRKIYANEYWDDRAVPISANCEDGTVGGIVSRLKERISKWLR